MKSLYSSINNFLHKWSDFSAAINKITDEASAFPLEIQGIQGCLFTYFLSELSAASRAKTLQAIQYNKKVLPRPAPASVPHAADTKLSAAPRLQTASAGARQSPWKDFSYVCKCA